MRVFVFACFLFTSLTKACLQCEKQKFIVMSLSFAHARRHTRVVPPLVTPFLTVKDNMDLFLVTSCKFSFPAAELRGATT